MSSNNSSYSIRDRGGNKSAQQTFEQAEKRQKLDSKAVPNSNASSVIYLGNVPADWNDQIVGSVVAGSGDIVDIRSRLDPSGRSKNFCFVEYTNSDEAAKALTLLSEIKLGPKRKFRVELSKEGLRGAGMVARPILKLDRSFKPYYVQLPPEMGGNDDDTVSSLNTPTPPVQQQAKQEVTSSLPAASTIPEIFLKASQQLPNFNQDTFKADDKISENLQSIPPTHLIELLATLKNLTATDMNSAQQAFGLSPNIPVVVVQALVMMGFVDINIINAALQQTAPQQTAPQQTPQSTPQQTQPTPQISDSRFSNFPPSTAQKLSKLDPQEAAMIVQVLSLSAKDIELIPIEQRAVIDNIRQQYL